MEHVEGPHAQGGVDIEGWSLYRPLETRGSGVDCGVGVNRVASSTETVTGTKNSQNHAYTHISACQRDPVFAQGAL